jgi:hypothetical protein
LRFRGVSIRRSPPGASIDPQGATLVREVEDVLEQITPHPRRAEMAAAAAIRRPAAVRSGLVGGPASVDDLIQQCAFQAEILATMLDLSLRSRRQVAGRQFQLTGRFAGVGGLQ